MNILYEPQLSFDIDSANGKGHSMNYMHYHNVYELFFIDDGNRSVVIGDTIVNLAKFDVGLIPLNAFHRTAGPYYSRTIIYFSPQFLEEYFSPKSIQNLSFCFHTSVIHLTPNEYLYAKKKIVHMQEEWSVIL